MAVVGVLLTFQSLGHVALACAGGLIAVTLVSLPFFRKLDVPIGSPR